MRGRVPSGGGRGQIYFMVLNLQRPVIASEKLPVGVVSI